MIKHTEEECQALEGKEIVYLRGGWGSDAVVIGCDPDVGITIVQKSDPENKFVCLPGPITKDHSAFKEHYIQLFNYYISKITEGVIVADSYQSIRPVLSSHTAKLAPCPFS